MVLNTDQSKLNAVEANAQTYGIVMYDISQDKMTQYNAFVSKLHTINALRLNLSVWLIRWSDEGRLTALWNEVLGSSGKFGEMHTVAFVPKDEAEIRVMAEKSIRDFMDHAGKSMKESIETLEERIATDDKIIPVEIVDQKKYAITQRAKRRLKTARGLALAWNLTQETDYHYRALRKIVEAETEIEEG